MSYLFLFDLDNTLFDSASYRNSLFTKIAEICTTPKNPVTKKYLEEMYSRQINKIGFFDPEVFLHDLINVNYSKINLEKLKLLLYDLEIIHGHFHSDVISTFKTLSKIGEIGIFSQGDSKLQSAKISKVSQWLTKDKIHVTKDKKAQLKKVFTKHKKFTIYFIDDMLSILYEAKKVDPQINTIWIKRGKYAENQKSILDFTPEASVGTLHEVVEFITSSIH